MCCTADRIPGEPVWVNVGGDDRPHASPCAFHARCRNSPGARARERRRGLRAAGGARRRLGRACRRGEPAARPASRARPRCRDTRPLDRARCFHGGARPLPHRGARPARGRRAHGTELQRLARGSPRPPPGGRLLGRLDAERRARDPARRGSHVHLARDRPPLAHVRLLPDRDPRRGHGLPRDRRSSFRASGPTSTASRTCRSCTASRRATWRRRSPSTAASRSCSRRASATRTGATPRTRSGSACPSSSPGLGCTAGCTTRRTRSPACSWASSPSRSPCSSAGSTASRCATASARRRRSA